MDRRPLIALGLCAALLVSGGTSDVRAPGAADLPEVAAGPEERSEFGAAEITAFMQRVNPGMAPAQMRRIVAAIVRYSDKYDLSAELVTAVLWRESHARPWVRSPKGAVGLMQVMPHMFDPLDMAGNIATVESNVEAGCMILADNIRRLGEEEGILAYFWGSDIRGASYLTRVQKARDALRAPSKS